MYKITLEMEVDGFGISVYLIVPGLPHFSETFRFTMDEKYYYMSYNTDTIKAKNLEELLEKLAKRLLSGVSTQTQPWI